MDQRQFCVVMVTVAGGGERDCLVCLCLFNNAVVISIGLIKECVFKISLTLF